MYFKGTSDSIARVVSEEFSSRLRFGNHRNPLCISRFSNRKVGTKDPLSAAADWFRGSQAPAFSAPFPLAFFPRYGIIEEHLSGCSVAALGESASGCSAAALAEHDQPDKERNNRV